MEKTARDRMVAYFPFLPLVIYRECVKFQPIEKVCWDRSMPYSTFFDSIIRLQCLIERSIWIFCLDRLKLVIKSQWNSMKMWLFVARRISIQNETHAVWFSLVIIIFNKTDTHTDCTRLIILWHFLNISTVTFTSSPNQSYITKAMQDKTARSPGCLTSETIVSVNRFGGVCLGESADRGRNRCIIFWHPMENG